MATPMITAQRFGRRSASGGAALRAAQQPPRCSRCRCRPHAAARATLRRHEQRTRTASIAPRADCAVPDPPSCEMVLGWSQDARPRHRNEQRPCAGSHGRPPTRKEELIMREAKPAVGEVLRRLRHGGAEAVTARLRVRLNKLAQPHIADPTGILALLQLDGLLPGRGPDASGAAEPEIRPTAADVPHGAATTTPHAGPLGLLGQLGALLERSDLQRQLPSVSLPSVSLPSVSLPSVSRPSVSLPSVSLPSVSLPTISLTPASLTPASL